MNRLHLPLDLQAESATVRGDALSYLRDVLRLRPGAPLEVFDGKGHACDATLDHFGDEGALLKLTNPHDVPLPGVRVRLLQGLPKADKFELIVQKSVELGASEIVPVVTERSIVKLDAHKAVERVARWQKIADEAARQCGRADVARIAPVVSLDRALTESPDEMRVVLDEEERSRRFRDLLPGIRQSCTVLIGPEGGLTREEIAAAQRAGFVAATLGPRILRTETVALAVLAIVQHVRGDLG